MSRRTEQLLIRGLLSALIATSIWAFAASADDYERRGSEADAARQLAGATLHPRLEQLDSSRDGWLRATLSVDVEQAAYVRAGDTPAWALPAADGLWRTVARGSHVTVEAPCGATLLVTLAQADGTLAHADLALPSCEDGR